MSNLIDGHGSGLRRMMTDAKSQEVEPWAISGDDELEDHSETTGRRRNVDLDALGKLGTVASFCIAGPQLGAGDSIRLVVALGRFGGLSASWCRPRHVLAEGLGVEASRETQLAHQRLPLAVGGEHVRAVLRQKSLPLLLSGLASA